MMEIGQVYNKWFESLVNTVKQDDRDILFQHFGYFQEDFVYSLTAAIENKLIELGFSKATAKQAFITISEALINIDKHGKSSAFDLGGMIVSVKNNNILVSVSNIAPQSQREYIVSRLSELNDLDEKEVNERYQELLKRSIVSNANGIGLGFVSIRRNSNYGLIHYYFKPIDDESMIFATSFRV